MTLSLLGHDRRVRIMVVDDEPAVREAVDRALRLEGYDTDLAGDGAEALEALAARAPDALVLDGAARRDIGAQFLAESLLLASAGGIAGVALGAVVGTGYAAGRGWQAVVPAVAVGGGVLAAVAIGAVAGLYPALRAARLSPTEALRSV